MSHKVLITDIAWPDIAIEEDILARAKAVPVLAPRQDEASLITSADGCCAIMTCWARTTSKVIEACSDCKIVARFGIGLDNIDVEFCTRSGIPVTNVPDYCIGEVADHALALILACNRKISFYDKEIKAGRYQLQAGYSLRRVAGQRLGIIGFGKTGRAVAQRAKAFGFKVLVHSRSLTNAQATEAGVQMVALDELLREADYVSLHLPLMPETEGLIGARELDWMKASAFVINTARGGLIDSGALLAAIEDGQVGGAALDVTDPEPLPENHPLVRHERVIHTPHAAFFSEESVAELRTRTAEEVVRALLGHPLQNQVNE